MMKAKVRNKLIAKKNSLRVSYLGQTQLNSLTYRYKVIKFPENPIAPRIPRLQTLRVNLATGQICPTRGMLHYLTYLYAHTFSHHKHTIHHPNSKKTLQYQLYYYNVRIHYNWMWDTSSIVHLLSTLNLSG